MYKWNYVTQSCPTESQFRINLIAAYVLFAMKYLIPIAGVCLAALVSWLSGASDAFIWGAMLASLVVTLPLAFLAKQLSDTSMANVVEADCGERPAFG